MRATLTLLGTALLGLAPISLCGCMHSQRSVQVTVTETSLDLPLANALIEVWYPAGKFERAPESTTGVTNEHGTVLLKLTDHKRGAAIGVRDVARLESQQFFADREVVLHGGKARFLGPA